MMMFVNGSAELYLGLLKDMFNMVLIHQDEIGMSDSNALGSLQLIAMLHKDIRDIGSDDCLAQMLGLDEEVITFRVEDTGCGIRQEDLGKIFEDFRQVDSKRNRSVEGTGLGTSCGASAARWKDENPYLINSFSSGFTWNSQRNPCRSCGPARRPAPSCAAAGWDGTWDRQSHCTGSP